MRKEKKNKQGRFDGVESQHDSINGQIDGGQSFKLGLNPSHTLVTNTVQNNNKQVSDEEKRVKREEGK